ncbi:MULTISPECIES: histidine phosphatase family protein [Paenibacillus]|uniref:histidine phosphatase family protein n=1 Tax=Paenibacillus TaxID=44249 RepID=UPI0022B92C86|nr:histidine phosphatase family protein [Paenibacillus caseinilyticus]MCZ8520658.1 histidine phosphatase family protein [Paenibacillus caseinilyticus]
MDMVFVLHGESEHSLNEEGRMMKDPRLTEAGRREAERLRLRFRLSAADAVLAGPTLRMLETAQLWTLGSECTRMAHPLVGPRQHPVCYDFRTHPCDLPLEQGRLRADFPDWEMPADLPEHLWLQGIHTLPGLLFAQQADRFLQWCRQLQKERVFIVTDAGTTDAYIDHIRSRCSQSKGACRVNPHGQDWRFAISV